jgi:hypothetical protein
MLDIEWQLFMREFLNGNCLHKRCAYQVQFTAALLLCLNATITFGYFYTLSFRSKHTAEQCCQMFLKLHILLLILLSDIHYQIYHVLSPSLFLIYICIKMKVIKNITQVVRKYSCRLKSDITNCDH